MTTPINSSVFLAGWGKCNLGIIPQGYAMHGFGNWHNRATGQQSELFARAFFLEDANGGQLYFCCVDMGYVTHAMREGVCQQLKEKWGDAFQEERLIMTCTHTHSGPGGCTHDVLYNVVTPGFLPKQLEAVVGACVIALQQAKLDAAPTTLGLTQGRFDNEVDIAWNRSIKAYNRNPDVTVRADTETHLALDRQMQLITLKREGELVSLLSLFGVHATCVGNAQTRYDGDNKGYAASHAERVLAEQGKEGAVAIFAQATAGDVSPHYHGPGQMARRRRIKGDAEYAYARRNGELQSQFALGLAAQGNEAAITGSLDAVLTYVDFSHVHADPRFAQGDSEAWTSEPCHGVAFFTGTPVDGPGMPGILGWGAKRIANGVRRHRLNNLQKFNAEDQQYFQRLYAAQGPKAILLEAGRKKILGQSIDKLMMPDFADPLVGEMKRQARIGAINKSAMVPTVLPLQIARLGNLAIVCCPGEFTTTAGERVRQTVAKALGDTVQHILICTYCNDYMGYVTTYEEYQEQAYEGGHTIFGQWTLAGFQTCFEKLAQEITKPEAERQHDRNTRPAPAPADELALRSNIPAPL